MNSIRSFDAATLINLPKKNGNGLAALVVAVMAVKNLPAVLVKPQARLKKALKVLQRAQEGVAATSSGEQRAADDAEDGIFRGIYQWLQGCHSHRA